MRILHGVIGAAIALAVTAVLPPAQALANPQSGSDPKRLDLSTSGLLFGEQVVGQTSAPQTVRLTATGTSPVAVGTATISGDAPDSFGISGDTCSGVTLAVGGQCTVSVVAHPDDRGMRTAELWISSDTISSPQSVLLSVWGDLPNDGTYYPVTPSRILDTREGIGASKAPAGPGATLHLQVAGQGGVPASGVAAVVLNVTVVQPTGWGHVTVYPAGQAKPTASSLNFVPGWSGANSVTVALGSGGQVALFNSGGNTHLIADVVGYYALDNTIVAARGYGGEFQPAQPERLFDSRVDWGEKLEADHWVQIPVSYGQVFDPHIRALAVNVTAVDPAWPGYLTGFSGSGWIPNASTLNIEPGTVVPNFAVIPTSICTDCGGEPVPSIGIYTSTHVHVIVDIVGFYDDGTFTGGADAGMRFMPQSPRRIADSRHGQGMPGALGQASTASIAPPADALTPETYAVALNVTAVAPTADTFIAVWPNGRPLPVVSTLNPSRGQVVPNAAVTLLGQGDRFNVYNHGGSTDVIVDMVGSFYYLPLTDDDAEQAAGAEKPAEIPPVTRLRPRLHHL